MQVDAGLVEFVLTVVAGYLLLGIVAAVVGVVVLLVLLNKFRSL